MIPKTKHGTFRRLYLSPWIIVTSAALLLIIVAVLAVQNYHREKNFMARILSEKGVALIHAVEAGARTGMMGMQWGQQPVQTLLEQTARMPDVFFLAVVRQDGLVLAHSDRSRIGLPLKQFAPMITLTPIGDAGWQLADMQPHSRSFIVYSVFQPFTETDEMSRKMVQSMRRSGMMMGQGKNWCFPPQNKGENRIIIVGLNPRAFDEGHREDIRNTVIISGVLVVLGLAGFISLFWMLSFRSTDSALRDTAALADKIVTSLPVGLIATDSNGKIVYHNRAAQRITGADLSRALGKDLPEIFPGPLCGLIETMDCGEPISEVETECEFVEGKVVPVSISAFQIINEDGRFIGQVMILRDLGEVRRLQAEIRRQEKLAAIGGLATGVAHEIRNPLSSIKGIATYYKSKFRDGSEDKEMAGVMIQEVDRLNRVISELLEFARPSQLNLRPTNMNDLLEHSVRLVRQEAIAQNVNIRLNLTPTPVEMEIDPDRLTQCLLNLYLNALQAMEKGGQLTIATSVKEDGCFMIDVRDSGSGIRSDELSKVFDPYYTTKSQGTGLGLAIIHKIVEAHHGMIKVRSAAGQGAVFSISLPIHKEK